MPYINCETSENSSVSREDISYIPTWGTPQVRTDLALTYGSLKKLGCRIVDHYSISIPEPNSVINNAPVCKGRNRIYCSFYNLETESASFSDPIGSIDIRVPNLTQNGMSIFLPGEITFGSTKEALLSACKVPHENASGFAADTYKGNTKSQSVYGGNQSVNRLGNSYLFKERNSGFRIQV